MLGLFSVHTPYTYIVLYIRDDLVQYTFGHEFDFIII